MDVTKRDNERLKKGRQRGEREKPGGDGRQK